MALMGKSYTNTATGLRKEKNTSPSPYHLTLTDAVQPIFIRASQPYPVSIGDRIITNLRFA